MFCLCLTLRKGKIMHANQLVAAMVDEVLERQALARVRRTGESFEDALDAVLDTEAGQQLQELRDGPHRHEKADEWQASIAQQRIEERVDSRGPTHSKRILNTLPPSWAWNLSWDKFVNWVLHVHAG